MSIDDLRRDVVAEFAAAVGVKPEELTPEVIEKHAHEVNERFLKDHLVVPVTRITNIDDVARLEGAHAMQFAVLAQEEAIRDAAAELEQQLTDYVDIARELEPIDRHRERKLALELVGQLDELGCRVAIGTSKVRMKFGNGKELDTVFAYVVVTSVQGFKPAVAVPRANLRF